MLISSTFASNGSLSAQSVERGANNGEVLCSRLSLVQRIRNFFFPDSPFHFEFDDVAKSGLVFIDTSKAIAT